MKIGCRDSDPLDSDDFTVSQIDKLHEDYVEEYVSSNDEAFSDLNGEDYDLAVDLERNSDDSLDDDKSGQMMKTSIQQAKTQYLDLIETAN